MTEMNPVAGPLTGVTVVELAGIGPAPFAAMVLADMEATVIRIDRPATARPAGGVSGPASPIVRNRRSIVVDLRTDAAIDIVLRLVARADALVEGFRPGVAERLHPHLMARGSFRAVGSTTEPAPAPRFLPEVTGETRPAAQPGRDTDTILAELGLAAADVAELRRCGAVQ